MVDRSDTTKAAGWDYSDRHAKLRSLSTRMTGWLVSATCAFSLFTSAVASAHTLPRIHTQHANDFQALRPDQAPRFGEASPMSFGTGEDSHDTATGGPAGGLIDRN